MSPTASPGGGENRLLLVLSPERSGSTLLATMLGGHSRVFAPPELHLLRFADFDAWNTGYPLAFESLLDLLAQLRAPADPKEIRRRFTGRPVEEVIRWLGDQCGNGTILVDKTPAYGRSDAALARAEGLRPAYLWLVRHPLGVADSRVRRSLAKRRESPRPIARLRYLLALAERVVDPAPAREVRREVARWTEVHERLEAFFSTLEPTRWTRIHFESLVRHPATEVERLCRWLRLEPEPAMLQPTANVPAALRWGLGDEQLRQHEGIDPRTADRWKARLGDRFLDARSTALLRRLGGTVSTDP